MLGRALVGQFDVVCVVHSVGDLLRSLCEVWMTRRGCFKGMQTRWASWSSSQT